MGRGRAKAKQTKVARDLKYRSQETDFGALAKELHGDSVSEGSASAEDDSEEDREDLEDSQEYDDWSRDSR